LAAPNLGRSVPSVIRRQGRRGSFSRAFSSEVDTGSREESASKQEARAQVLIQSEPQML
jgi:hypothetical protein